MGFWVGSGCPEYTIIIIVLSAAVCGCRLGLPCARAAVCVLTAALQLHPRCGATRSFGPTHPVRLAPSWPAAPAQFPFLNRGAM